MPRTPIETLFDTVVWRCTTCGAVQGQCDCTETCSCGWRTPRGTACQNPATTRCSTKLHYGTPAQQQAWRRQRREATRLEREAAQAVLRYIAEMYPPVDAALSPSARLSIRQRIMQAVQEAIREDRLHRQAEEG